MNAYIVRIPRLTPPNQESTHKRNGSDIKDVEPKVIQTRPYVKKENSNRKGSVFVLQCSDIIVKGTSSKLLCHFETNEGERDKR